MAEEIDVEHDTIIALFEVDQHYPGPRKPKRSTVFRWVNIGLKVAGNPGRVKLPSVKLNGIRCTSVEALSRFLRVSNGQSAVPSTVVECIPSGMATPTNVSAG